jgi:hypothetical protein
MNAAAEQAAPDRARAEAERMAAANAAANADVPPDAQAPPVVLWSFRLLPFLRLPM